MNKYMPAKFSLTKIPYQETGEHFLVVDVDNCLDTAIEDVSVTWYYDYDDPFNKSPRRMEGWIEFIGSDDGPLPPGSSRAFTFPLTEMQTLLSIIASLSSERHFVLVKCDDETDRIDGRTFGGWVEKEFGQVP